MNPMVGELRGRLIAATARFQNYVLPAEAAGCSAALLVLKWTTYAYPDLAVRSAFQHLEWESTNVDAAEVVQRLDRATRLFESILGLPEAGRVVARAIKDERIPNELWCRYSESLRSTAIGLFDQGELARVYLDLLAPPDDQSDQFSTPPSIVDLTYRLLGPRPGMTLHDLTCARGSWLLEAGRRAREIDGGLRPLAISGKELRRECVADARVALWMAGLSAQLTQGNSLAPDPGTDTRGSGFDRVYSHPPFGNNRESDTHHLPKDFDGCSVSMAFVVRALSLLNEAGRAVVLNPITSLSRRGGDEAVRRRLVESDVLERVIQLPVGVFPGSSARACVLVLDRRKSPRKKGRVTFVDLSREYTGTPNQSELTANGIALALAAPDGGFIDGISVTVDETLISSSDFDLDVRRYLSKSVWRGEPFKFEWDTFKQLLAQRNRIESAVEDVLKKLGPVNTDDEK